MAIGMTTTTGLPPAIQQSLDEMILSTPTASLIHNIAAVKKTLQKNGGDTLRMQRYNKMSLATVPLGNTGITPPAEQLSKVFIDAKIAYYGKYAEINEQVVLQNQEDVLANAARVLGISLRETEDVLTRDLLKATASYINCTDGVNGRLFAVVKSFLMVLKLLARNGEDNKAELAFVS